MALPGDRRDQFRLTLRNDLAELGRLEAELDEFLRARNVPEAAAHHLRLVLDELITNVIRHAYEDAGPHEISVVLTLTADKAVVEIEDDGRPFDPWAVPEPDVELPLDERLIGGLGIHLVRNVAEQLGYRRAGRKNHVEVGIALREA